MAKRMRLSKKERELLKHLHPTYPLRSAAVLSNPDDVRTATNLLDKGFLVIDHDQTEDKYYFWISESGRRLLKEHPELLRENAFSAFLERSCTFVKEHFEIALYAVLCVILVLLITILMHE